MNQLIPLSFEDKNIRAVVIDGKPYMVGKDVCEALGYKDTVNAMKQHCKGVAKHHPLQTAGGIQDVRVLNEADVLRLITNSNLPAAEKIERWIFEEVLPTIYRTGSYQMSRPLGDQYSREDLMGEAAVSRLLMLFSTLPQLSSNDVIHVVELATAKSPLTGEYLMAQDVANAIQGNALRPIKVSETALTKKIPEIRRIIESFGPPRFRRCENGRYFIKSEVPQIEGGVA